MKLINCMGFKWLTMSCCLAFDSRKGDEGHDCLAASD